MAFVDTERAGFGSRNGSSIGEVVGNGFAICSRRVCHRERYGTGSHRLLINSRVSICVAANFFFFLDWLCCLALALAAVPDVWSVCLVCLSVCLSDYVCLSVIQSARVRVLPASCRAIPPPISLVVALDHPRRLETTCCTRWTLACLTSLAAHLFATRTVSLATE